MPSGTRLEVSNDYIAKVEDVIRGVVKPDRPGHDRLQYRSLSGSIRDLHHQRLDGYRVRAGKPERDHSIGSYVYMQDVREKLAREMPELTTYFQAGGLVDSVVNQGLPAPIDVQVSSMDMDGAYALAKTLAQKIKAIPNVSGVYIPQDLDYPGIALNIDREKASLIGLSAKDVVDNVVTALTSDGMVAPSYWIDPKSGNNYMVTVQYAKNVLNNMSMESFENIPLRGVRPPGYGPMQQAHEESREMSRDDHTEGYTPLSSVADLKLINTPTEVDHYQIRRVIDIYVSTRTEALQAGRRAM